MVFYTGAIANLRNRLGGGIENNPNRPNNLNELNALNQLNSLDGINDRTNQPVNVDTQPTINNNARNNNVLNNTQPTIENTLNGINHRVQAAQVDVVVVERTVTRVVEVEREVLVPVPVFIPVPVLISANPDIRDRNPDNSADVTGARSSWCTIM